MRSESLLVIPLLIGLPAIFGCSSDHAPAAAGGLAPAPAQFQPLAAALAHVCDASYAGDPNAPAFDATQDGPHWLVFIGADGTAHPANSALPNAWWPASADQVELVACASELASQDLPECRYDVPNQLVVERQTQFVGVRVVSRRTGQYNPVNVYGSSPGECPVSYSAPLNAGTVKIVGGTPGAADYLSAIIDRYVPVPTCGGSLPFGKCLQCWQNAAGADGFCGGMTFEGSATPAVLRSGGTSTLTWQWQFAPDVLFRSYYGIDWSTSLDASRLTSLSGETTSTLPLSAGMYSFRARALLPGSTTESNQSQDYSLQALDLPVIQFNWTAPALARVGQETGFSQDISGRDGGRIGEQFRYTWVERPAGSAAALPISGDPRGGGSWSFTPDLVGDYRVQVEYDDGAGFSAPAVSPPITAIDHPLLSVPNPTQDVPVGSATLIDTMVSYPAAGTLVFSWTLTSKPATSTLPSDLGQNGNLLFTPDVAGTYVIRVVVTDSAGTSDPVDVTLTAA